MALRGGVAGQGGVGRGGHLQCGRGQGGHLQQFVGFLQPALEVLECQADLGVAGTAAAGRAVEDDVHHLPAAQALGRLLAQHPLEGIDHVALAAAVGADDGGDAVVKIKYGLIGEALKAHHRKAFQLQVSTPPCLCTRTPGPSLGLKTSRDMFTIPCTSSIGRAKLRLPRAASLARLLYISIGCLGVPAAVVLARPPYHWAKRSGPRAGLSSPAEKLLLFLWHIRPAGSGTG